MSWRSRASSIVRAGPSSRPLHNTPLHPSPLRGRPRHAPLSTTVRPLASSKRQQRPALASRPPDPLPIYHPPNPLSPSSSDDSSLKAHFDQYDVSATTGRPSGLFLLPPLDKPSSLPRLTDRTLIHGCALVDRICAAPDDPSGREVRLVVKNLDRLSDLLCGVIDMCELVRNAHPDQRWVSEADRAYERLCSFMNSLNTDQGLYKVRRGIAFGTGSDVLLDTASYAATSPFCPLVYR